jgi:hypothetical protein
VTQPNKVKIINLLRSRGDTDPIKFRLSNKKTKKAIDVTNDTFTLSVSEESSPTGNDYVFQSTASITEGFDGRISFPVPDASADNLDGKFYDVQRDYNGYKKTIIKGVIQFEQDITK